MITDKQHSKLMHNLQDYFDTAAKGKLNVPNRIYNYMYLDLMYMVVGEALVIGENAFKQTRGLRSASFEVLKQAFKNDGFNFVSKPTLTADELQKTHLAHKNLMLNNAYKRHADELLNPQPL